jgi:uncharacterized protein DUF4340
MTSWRGSFAHGTVLVVSLLFAWQTWTRPRAQPKTDAGVALWEGRPADVGAIEYVGEKRSTKVERRTEGGEAYLWITTEREKPKSPAAKDAAPAEGEETTSKAFVGGKSADKLVEDLASPRAARALGKLSAERLKDLGLADAKDTLTVTLRGQRRAFKLGAKVYGGSERYALDPASGEGFVLEGSSLRDLETGESSLMQRDLHAFSTEEAKSLLISAGKRTREVVRLAGSDRANEWADSATPDKKDEAVGNWMTKVGQLRALEYVSDEAVLQTPAGVPTAPEQVLRLDLRGEGGKPLGFLELHRVAGDKDKPDYLVRTETTRVLVKVSQHLGEELEQDLATVLGD